MISSMTAFARIEQQETFGTLIWEIRSVNQRFLEPNFKLPEFAKACEFNLRQKLRERISRGKLECSLRFEKAQENSQTIKLNTRLLEALLAANAEISQRLPQVAAEKASTFLQWPNMIESVQTDQDRLEEALLNSFDQAISQLIKHRQHEGAQLEQFILQRLQQIDEISDKVRRYLPEIIEQQKQKLLDRFAGLALELDQTRLEQEIVLLAQKIDVDEELDRLSAHIKAVKQSLKQTGPCGRRLDFLMQELNREANTLGSKSINSETSQASVDLKVAIEQMREQIQNIE